MAVAMANGVVTSGHDGSDSGVVIVAARAKIKREETKEGWK
jgi:hypothetical protein